MRQTAVTVLGTVGVSVDGRPRPLRGRRQRALLAALAVRHPRAVAVDDLVDAVWADDPPAQARTTLQTYVSRLRAALGEDAVEFGPAGYRLGADATVDADSARRELAGSRERLAAGHAREAVELARTALDRWDGTALAELADTDWFGPAAVTLGELRDDLQGALAEGLVASGRAVEAIGPLEAAVRAHPFREPVQLLLIRALAEAGRATEALRAADRYRAALRDQTGLDPGPGLSALEARVLAGELGPPAADRTHGVAAGAAIPHTASRTADGAGPPVAPRGRGRLARPSPLVGRDDDLAALRDALGSARLVTVLGPGGVGKTRLVAELLAELLAEGPAPGATAAGDAVVVDLAPVGSGDAIAAIGAALGYLAGRADADAVVDAVGADPLLLVLDNCEHVVADLRVVARALLDGRPGVSIVATSRTRLGLPDEHLVPLQPLATTGDHPAAVQLFADCLRRAAPRGDLAPDSPAVRALCARLDGLPLAIQLAAGRAALLGVEELTARLASAPELLATPGDAGDSRHASLGALVEWSYGLLGPSAQRLLAIASVFEGEFGLTDLEQVAGAVLDEPVAPAFGRLIDTSMVALGAATGRFRLLDTIRWFAAGHLQASPDAPAVRRAHTQWVAGQVAAIAGDAVGPREGATADRLAARRADLLAGLAWAASSGDDTLEAAVIEQVAAILIYRPDAELAGLVLRSAGHAATHHPPTEATSAAAGARAGYLLGALDEAETLARRALAAAGEGADAATARARALHACGVVHLYRGRFAEARRDFETVTTDGGATAVDRLDAYAGAALAATYAGEPDAAAALAARHRSLADALDTEASRAFADFVDGERHLAAGRVDVALDLLRRSGERAWATGATFVWGLASTVLAGALVHHGQHAEAVGRLPELLRRWRLTATWPQLWTSLRLAAEALAARARDTEAPAEGRPDVAAETAVTVLAAAEADPSAPGVGDGDSPRIAQLEGALADRLGPERVALARARAEVLDRRQVLDLAIDTLEAIVAATPA